jgi:NAD(P)-dependent dehydrogenase (short-subunit alcohol dehydrogenase family)
MLRAFQKRDPELYNAFIGRVPLGRPGTATEVAEAVRWLAGAQFCTGATVVLDGGYTAQ